MTEARVVCEYIEGRGTRDGFLEQFEGKMTPGSDPDGDLQRVGVANQTTMLSGESLAIAAEVGKSRARRGGAASLAEHFRTFDTICSATQERQDTVLKLIAEPLDLMVVIGGDKMIPTTRPPPAFNQKKKTAHITKAPHPNPLASNNPRLAHGPHPPPPRPHTPRPPPT